MLLKYMLEFLFIIVFFYYGTEAFSCNKHYDDPHRCDKIQQQTVKCILIPKPLFHCRNTNTNICYHKLCFNVDPICTLSCCDGWEEDHNGRCSKRSGSDSIQHYKNSDVSTKVVSGVIVAILFLVLAVLSAALCRVCKSRQNIRRRRCNRPQPRHRTSVFTVYENEPPPYEVAVRSKLPDYSQCNDLPPEYQESENISCEGNNCASGNSPSDQLAVNIATAEAASNPPNLNMMKHASDSDMV